MITFTLTEPQLFVVGFCIVLAGLLAALVLGCDRDGESAGAVRGHFSGNSGELGAR